MSTLHTVSRSPFRDSSLASCLRVARPGSALLLMEDAVYAAVDAGDAAVALRDALDRLSIYVLAADVAARGLNPQSLLEDVTLVDYEGFVDLACRHDKVQAWI